MITLYYFSYLFAISSFFIAISDEIHADFIYDNKKFIPMVDINEYTKNHTITCVSCAKSFNLAGLNVSAIFIKNREQYQCIDKYTSLNGLQAMKTAYEESEYRLDYQGFIRFNIACPRSQLERVLERLSSFLNK